VSLSAWIRSRSGEPTPLPVPLAQLDAWLHLESAAEQLRSWFGDSLEPLLLDTRLLVLALDRDVAEIDRLLSKQINVILHAGELQHLEASWRGLRYLTQAAEQAPLAKIRVLSVSWGEIARDVERASDFDRTQLYDRIYTQEFGTLGGQPFGLLLGAFEVQHRPGPDHPTDDVTVLKTLAAIAAAAFAPLVLGAAPQLLELTSFHQLGRGFDLRATFQQLEYQRWQAMRASDDMRFIGLVLPHVLLRLPYYSGVRSRMDGFQFTETLHASGAEDYLWGNACFAFGTVVLRAFASYGWFADIRGAPLDELGGGVVTGLPVASFATDRAGVATKPSLDCVLTDTQEQDLADLGFIALRRGTFTDEPVFYGNYSLQTSARLDRTEADVNARLARMLQYTLCVSRFAHHLKMLGRSFIGTTTTAAECQEALQRWLTSYCEGSDSASRDIKARYPLREARVEVKEVPGKSGAYTCVLFLRPHFQLDDIASGFRLTTQLAPAAGASTDGS